MGHASRPLASTHFTARVEQIYQSYKTFGFLKIIFIFIPLTLPGNGLQVAGLWTGIDKRENRGKVNKMPTRIVIYAKDIMNITGRGERTARQMMADIKKKFDRTSRGGIIIDDFCSYTGLKHETVKASLV